MAMPPPPPRSRRSSRLSQGSEDDLWSSGLSDSNSPDSTKRRRLSNSIDGMDPDDEIEFRGVPLQRSGISGLFGGMGTNDSSKSRETGSDAVVQVDGLISDNLLQHAKISPQSLRRYRLMQFCNTSDVDMPQSLEISGTLLDEDEASRRPTAEAGNAAHDELKAAVANFKRFDFDLHNSPPVNKTLGDPNESTTRDEQKSTPPGGDDGAGEAKVVVVDALVSDNLKDHVLQHSAEKELPEPPAPGPPKIRRDPTVGDGGSFNKGSSEVLKNGSFNPPGRLQRRHSISTTSELWGEATRLGGEAARYAPRWKQKHLDALADNATADAADAANATTAPAPSPPQQLSRTHSAGTGVKGARSIIDQQRSDASQSPITPPVQRTGMNDPPKTPSASPASVRRKFVRAQTTQFTETVNRLHTGMPRMVPTPPQSRRGSISSTAELDVGGVYTPSPSQSAPRSRRGSFSSAAAELDVGGVYMPSQSAPRSRRGSFASAVGADDVGFDDGTLLLVLQQAERRGM